MNKLEAIVLLTTSSEIRSGQFLSFCNQFLKMKYCGMPLNIVVNNSKFDGEMCAFLNEITIFSSIQIFDVDIPPADDIYIRETKYDGKIPRLGLSSGPNILFFEAMRMFEDVNTVLVLETDCILKPNCFEVCKTYVSSMCDFLVSGSKYIGRHVSWYPGDSLFHHLNGVAFYRTGSKEFQELLKRVEDFIAMKVKMRKQALAYDVAIMTFIHENLQRDSQNKRYYTAIESKMLTNTFILNYSVDHEIDWGEIDHHYPNHVILHSKLKI